MKKQDLHKEFEEWYVKSFRHNALVGMPPARANAGAGYTYVQPWAEDSYKGFCAGWKAKGDKIYGRGN